MLYFLTHRFKKNDILYFQRPDHACTAYFTKARIIVHLHGQQKTIVDRRRGTIPKLIYHLMERRSMKLASSVHATDSITSEVYRKAYPFLEDKLSVIPTGIDTEYFKPSDVPVRFRNLPINSKVLVYIGRLSYPKRVDQIIKAFDLLARKDGAACLVIAGNGKDMEELRQLASKSHASSRIFFTGELSKPEILNLLQAATVAILLSHTEGSPISLKECLACGIPVIVNDVGDVKEYIIPGKTGFIVNADSLFNVYNAVIDVMNNFIKYKHLCREVALKYEQTNMYQKIINMNSNASN